MTYRKFIFCFSAGCVLYAIGGLMASVLPTFWFFIAIGCALSLFSIIEFKRSIPKLSADTQIKCLVSDK